MLQRHKWRISRRPEGHTTAMRRPIFLNILAMPDFRTALSAAPAPRQITHTDPLLLIGSCFSEHIGQKLLEGKFNVLTNPFGIVYNPSSIAACLSRICAGNQAFVDADLFENAGLWHSWQHHGRFSHPDMEQALQGINTAYFAAAEQLRKTNFLLLTFGTSEVFSLRETGKVVANNHKMPANLFDLRRLSVAEIVEATLEALQLIRLVNPNIQLVLTVSPVRHLRSGLIENQRSKAALILACEEICRQSPAAQYFPAYELLLDDLRDYRFYAKDMVHPSDVAVDYVWQFFSDTFFAEKTRSLHARIERIQAAARHRPFHPDTAAHQAFVRAQLAAITGLKQEYPQLDFSAEVAVLQQGARVA